MTPKSFYRLAFLSPVLFPLLITYPLFRWNELMPSPVAGTLVFSFFGLLFGGLPYIVFAGVTLWRIRDRDAGVHRRVFGVLPLIFAPFLALCYFPLALIAFGESPSEAALTALMMGVAALIIGYAYVIVTMILFWILRGVGGIKGPLSA